MPDFKSMTPEELRPGARTRASPPFGGSSCSSGSTVGVTSTQEMTDLPKSFRAIIDQARGGALPPQWPENRSQSWTAP